MGLIGLETIILEFVLAAAAYAPWGKLAEVKHILKLISIAVFVETLVSHAKKARMTYCHVFSPVQFHSCTDAPLDFHPMSGPVCYLTTN